MQFKLKNNIKINSKEENKFKKVPMKYIYIYTYI